jgi:hypothetical protein
MSALVDEAHRLRKRVAVQLSTARSVRMTPPRDDESQGCLPVKEAIEAGVDSTVISGLNYAARWRNRE